MAGFGGAVKLTGESEYRRALKNITQDLRVVGSNLKAVTSAYDKNDNSTKALAEQSKALNKQLETEKSKLDIVTKQLNVMSKAVEVENAKHAQLEKTYADEKQKLDALGNTLGTTSKEYKDQQVVVSRLEGELKKSASAQEYNRKEMTNLQVQANRTQASINNTSRQLDNLGKEAQETSTQISNSSGGYTVMKNVMANLATQGINLAIGAMRKLGEVAISTGKQALGSYAEYEQLVGGVDTLFGKSSKRVQKYASEAYKTAGISANDYMQQVTSFSASLLKGLGGDTKKAADLANMAVKDMSDNSNKFGTDIESLQMAYQGFSKGQFQLLDNLKLGRKSVA